MRLIPVDDTGESTGAAVANNDYKLIPVDDAGEEIKPATPSLYDNVMTRPGAAVRSFLQGTGLKRGWAKPSSVPKYETLYSDDAQKLLQKIPGVTSLPPAIQEQVLATGSLPAAIVGNSVDQLTNPADVALMAGMEPLAKGIGNTVDSLKGLAERSPNVVTTLLKSPKWFEEQMGKSERSTIDEAAKLSDFIKAENPKVKGMNTAQYGKRLDSLDIPLTRGDLNDAHAFTIDEINSTGDPNLINTPGYAKLRQHADQLAPNTADFKSGLAKKEQVKVLNMKKNAGEFVTQDDYAALELTPEERAAIKNPRHADDPIDARTLQQLRRELRSVSGSSPVSQHAANQFEFNLGLKGSEKNPDFAELNALNQEYAPVISAQNKALREFSATDRFGIGGEKSLRRMASEIAQNKLSPTEEEYLRTLGSGNSSFLGLGPKLPASMDKMVANENHAAKLKRLSEQNSKVKTLATMAGTGLGIFKAKLLQRVLGQ